MIQSRATRQFWRLFSSLPAEVQQDAKRAYRFFRANPAYPGLARPMSTRLAPVRGSVEAATAGERFSPQAESRQPNLPKRQAPDTNTLAIRRHGGAFGERLRALNAH